MNESRFRAALLLTLTFAAGAAVGVASDRLELIPGVARATEAGAPERDGPPRRPPPGPPKTTIERFADDLGLTETQRTEIEGILDRYRASARALQRAVQPQYRSLMDSVRTEIEATLTPEQVEQYRALLRERYGHGDRDDARDDERRDER